MSHVQTTGADLLREIGRILHKAREDRGWTRQKLADVLGGQISTHSLAAYELATRKPSVARLAELCRALRISLPELVANAYRAAYPDEPVPAWRVDTLVLANTPGTAMIPLRNWARARHRQSCPDDSVLSPFHPGLDVLAGRACC